VSRRTKSSNGANRRVAFSWTSQFRLHAAVILPTASMTKPQLPIYPRPVSPLNAEPLRSNPADIFLDDSSDPDSNDEQHACKRRRIEKLGEQYLRGDGLCIMTAGLKGPLTGWVNPWSKRHMQGVARRAKMSRADVGKDGVQTALQAPGRSKGLMPVRPTNRSVRRGPSGQEEVDNGRSDGKEKWLKRTQDDKRSTSYAHSDSPTPTGKRGKRRTSDDVMPAKHLQTLTSKAQATPAKARLPIPILEPPVAEEWLGPTPILSADNKQDSTAGTSSSKRPQSFNPDSHTALSTVSLPWMPPEPHFADQCDGRTTDPTVEDNILNYDLKLNRKSVDMFPTSDRLPAAGSLKSLAKTQGERNHSSGSLDAQSAQYLDITSSVGTPIMPPQALTNVQARSKGKPATCTTEQRDGSTLKAATKPLIRENRPQSLSMPPGKMPQQSLSTQASTTTNAHAMPSAQVVPALQPHSAESYPSLTSKMIEPEVTPIENKVGTHQRPSAESALPTTTNPLGPRAAVTAISTTPDPNWANPNHADSLEFPRSREGIVPFSAFKSPPPRPDVTELDTQQMLAAITPLGFSTAKTTTLNPLNAQSPGTVRWTKLGKQKKRACFTTPAAADAISSRSWQGSIKGSLKVSKKINGEPKAGESLERLSQPSLFGKLGLDMETSAEEEEEDEGRGGTREDESRLGASFLLRGEPCKHGAPLSSGPLPPGGSITSVSSAQQQDAQQEVGRYQNGDQNIIEGRDDFNLASAMDDLGSFLGTWDMSKEATEFGSLTSRGCVKSALKSKSSSASTRR
jgi:hypothetical protein